MTNQNIQIKNKMICEFGSFLIALSLILDCRPIWGSITTSGNLRLFTFIGLIIGIFLSFISARNIQISKYAINIFFFLGIYIFIYLMQPSNNLQLANGILIEVSFLSIYMYIIVFFETHVMSLVIRYYINLLVLISMVSLFFWIFGSILKIIKPTGLVLSTWGTQYGKATAVNSYYNIYFETQSLNNIIRNSAIFTEPPMASLNFLIAFIFQILVNKNDKYHLVKEIILILGILSTMSSTGYIALLIIFLFRSIFGKYKNKEFLLPVILILSVISVIVIHYLFISKLENASGQTRADDFKAGYEAWKLHPYMGSGLNNNIYQNFMANWRRNNLGLSNTIMDVLVSGGIYMFVPYLISIIYSITVSLRKYDLDSIILVTIIVYLFITTIFTNTYILFFLFIFMVVNSNYQNKLSFDN